MQNDSINNLAIRNALKQAKVRGVKIKVLTDHTQAGANAQTTLEFDRNGFDLRLHSMGRIMHNKFGIFDQKKVITGSFNWTNPAESLNEENCLVLDDQAAVSEYESRFLNHLWVVNTAEKSKKYLTNIKMRFQTKSVLRKEIEKF